MTSAPSGEVTFLFTDVEGSTELWDRTPDSMKVALTEHDARVNAAVERHNGYVFTKAGDSFAVSFASPHDALAAAIEGQLSLLEPVGGMALKVRMALHTGTATVRDGDYFGVVVNRAARLMSAGHGGQILMSRMTADLLSEQLPGDLGLIDLGEHRLKGLAQPERIFQLRHPDLDDRVRRLRALEGPACNLPPQLTSFVGREREVATVQGLLAANRLVTLMGTGGAGKTRLALHAARDLLEMFPDGIQLVELAAITDDGVLVDEVAQVVGAQAKPGTETVDAVANAIGERSVLLILDNCEQLDAAVAELVRRLLSACPDVKVLATSRELLGVDGECVYRVPSLDLPPDGADAEASLEYDSVRLLAERAKLSEADFRVDDTNVADVVDICRHLDGIPLAIELAAARLRMMSPAQIATRLDERLRLLVDTSKHGSQRHHTLQAAIDWSYNLLDERERMLFRRLSWFSGDFSLEAAEDVGEFGPSDDVAVIDVLASLLDKSIVAPEHGVSGTMRYRLLESMRLYGRVRLAESDELTDIGVRHLDYYTQLSEAMQAQQREGDLGSALAQRDEEEDNLRAALRWALDERRFDFAGRIVGALGYLWYAGGLYREGIEWCRELFSYEPELPDDLNAAVLHAYGTLLGSWAQPVEGATLLRREVELRRRLADPVRLASALNNLGNVLQDIGDYVDGEVMLRESIAWWRSAGESPSLSFVSLGYGYLARGDHQRAAELFGEALVEASSVEDAYGTALATALLGLCSSLDGDTVEARRLVQDARARFEDLRVAPAVADADFNLAVISRDEGRSIDAAWKLLASLSVPEGLWYLAAQFWIMQVASSIIRDHGTAAKLIGAAVAHYDGSAEVQPAFVLIDLEATRRALIEQLGEKAFDRHVTVGRTLTQPDAVSLAVSALHDLIDHDETEQTDD